MPVVRPLPPAKIRALLESKGYKLIASDTYNWVFAKGDRDEPVMIPFAVPLVPLEIAHQVAAKTGFNDYFDLLATEDGEPFPADALGQRPS